ncbi:hypothetical protein LSHI6S_00040 [Leifsonia shinshuensis]
MMAGNHALSGAAAWLAITTAAPALPVFSGLPGLGALATAQIPMTAGIYLQVPAVALLGAVVAAGAAIAADADHHSATIAHSVPGIGPVFAGAVSAAAGGHRKGTHTLWAVAVVGVIAWMLHFFTWPIGDLGQIGVGLFLAAAPLCAFAAKSIKAIWFVRSWLVAWVTGAAIAALLVVALRDNLVWMPVAIVVGYATHLVGDMLTTGGIAPLYPYLPKPPEWWSRTPVLNRIWQTNGYMGIPILGKTGSVLEWALGIALAFYVGYCALHAGQTLAGVA